LQPRHTKGEESFFTRVPGTFQLHNTALGFNTQDPTRMKLMHKGPGGAGELAAGEGSLELTHKRHWTAIELTTDRPAKEDWLGTSPAGDGGGSVAAGPLRLQFRWGEGLRRAMRDGVSF
jgi:hypothetical protein